MLPRGEVQGRGKAGAECWEDGGAGAPAGPAFRPPYRVPSGISLHVDSLTDHSCSAESDGEKLPCRAGDALCESGSECKDKFEDLEDEEIVEVEEEGREREKGRERDRQRETQRHRDTHRERETDTQRDRRTQ